MKKNIPVEIIDEIIAEVRAIKSVELASDGNESRARSVTQPDIASAVDIALVEVSQALKDALDSDDEHSAQDSWWGKATEHPYEWRKGGPPDEGLLPRSGSSASWWNG